MSPNQPTYTPRPLLPTPPSLVQDGRFLLGTYKAPFSTINPLDADVRFSRWPRALKRFRLKEWQHFAFANERVYVSLALFDAKLLALAQVCIYDRALGKTIFHEKKLPPGQLKPLPNALFDARFHLDTKDFRITLHNHLAQGAHHITFDITATRTLPAVSGQFTCFEPLEHTEPIVVCLPFEQGRALYSHKCITPTQGTLRLGNQDIDFPKDRSYGLIDIHKGYYPHTMTWRWATGGGYQSNGTLLGFNLTNNQVRDQEAYNENCLWVDGKIHLLPPVQFSYSSADSLGPWSIRDSYGRVELTFQPEVLRKVDLNALVIQSRYRAPYGAFQGFLYDNDGNKHTVEQWFGMCEDFFLRI